MVMDQRNPNAVTEFVASVKNALKGSNVAADIRNAVEILIKKYGINTPVKK